ncbi:MAG: hypothetical protein M0P09_08115 [Acholeplasmataceae bacterium]|nr:hypothetical protein [Acholeplasmataceae bacterium]
MTKLKLSGGDIVLLKNGRVVEVADIKLNYIVVAFDEWFPFSDIVEIIEPKRKRKRKRR